MRTRSRARSGDEGSATDLSALDNAGDRSSKGVFDQAIADDIDKQMGDTSITGRKGKLTKFVNKTERQLAQARLDALNDAGPGADEISKLMNTVRTAVILRKELDKFPASEGKNKYVAPARPPPPPPAQTPEEKAGDSKSPAQDQTDWRVRQIDAVKKYIAGIEQHAVAGTCTLDMLKQMNEHMRTLRQLEQELAVILDGPASKRARTRDQVSPGHNTQRYKTPFLAVMIDYVVQKKQNPPRAKGATNFR